MNANATTDTSTSPRIYVASLSDYNNGRLHGEWIHATFGAEHIEEAVKEMLRRSKYPNVQVECPSCEGAGITEDSDGSTLTTMLDAMRECGECAGTGKVDSAEEWAIHDYEGFEGIKLSEWESFETVAALAEMIEEHGEAFAVWHDTVADGLRPDEWADAFQEQYAGEYEDLTEWAGQYMEDTGMLEDVRGTSLENYIDFESFGRDAKLGGDIWIHEAGYRRVFIFWNR